MKRTRVIALLLCLLLIVGLFGSCGKTEETGGEPAGTKGVENQVQDESKVTPENKRDVQGTKPLDNKGETSDKTPESLLPLSYQAGYIQNDIPKALGTLSIFPAGNETSGIVPTDGSFRLTTKEPVTKAELEENLHLMAASYGGELDFSIESEDDGFVILPKEPMQPDSVYRFVVGDEENPYMSFVFQTESKQLIKSVYPADHEVGVPTNTGVEVLFSEAVAADVLLERFIELSPKAKGELRRYPDGKTIVFVPETGLAENTVYTLTIKEGITGISGRKTEETVTTQFRTGIESSRNEKDISINLERQELSVVTGEAAELNLSCWYSRNQTLRFNDADVKIYAYRSFGDCVEAIKHYQTVKADHIYDADPYHYPTDALTKVGDFTAKVELPERYSWRTTLSLPVLEAGAYLVEVTLSGDVSGKEFTETKQLMLQVSDLLLYTESSDAKTLFWVNDATTGSVEGATLSITPFVYESAWNTDADKIGNGGFSATKEYKTDKDGVAIVPCNKETETAAFVLARAGDKEAFACVLNTPGSEKEQYYSFLYTDREEYFRNDTVRFFGILAPKQAGAELPKTIYLTTTDSINSVPVAVDASGWFEGSITLDDSARWYLNLRLSDEENNFIVSKSVNITNEEKPVYVAEASFDKLFYRNGEAVTATLTASFYDGTPASNLTFDAELSVRGDRYRETITTDDKGIATLSWKPISINSYDTSPVYVVFSAQLIGDELTNLWVSKDAPYFCTDKIFEVTRVVPEDGSDSYTKLSLYARDYSRLKTEADLQWPDFPKNTYGEKLDGSVTVRLNRTDITKQLISTEYDPISKTSYPNYRYESIKSTVSKNTQQIKNGELKLEHQRFKAGLMGYYEYSITYTDPETNRDFTQETYATAGNKEYFDYNEDQYHKLIVSEGPYDIGEKIRCEIRLADELVAGKPILFTLYTEKGITYHLSKDGSYELFFEKAMAPSANLYVTMADVGGIRMLGSRSLQYDFDNANVLDFTITTDKQVYRPGDTVHVTIQRGESAGKSGKDSFVAISVVDEACFDLQEQFIYLSQYMARNYFYLGRDQRFPVFGESVPIWIRGVVDSKDTSAAPTMEEAEAAMDAAPMENGALLGGASMLQDSANAPTIRKEFLDNPVFFVVPMEETTESKISFQVPDNITEWRITAIACDPYLKGGEAAITDVKLGYQVSDVITSLPFFVNAECNESFLKGDEVIASARVYGSQVESGTAVTYEGKLFDEEDRLISTVSGHFFSGETAWLNFGTQDCGGYYIEIVAITEAKISPEEAAALDSLTLLETENKLRSDKKTVRDGVRLPLRVIESGTLLPVQKDLSVAELSTLTPSLYPIQLSFYDASYQPYVEAIGRMLRTYTNRNDSKVAYAIAAGAAEKLFGQNGFYAKEVNEARQSISESYGLLSKLSYGEGDVLFSAMVAALAPELLTEGKKTELSREFESILKSGEAVDFEELAAALFGLCALGRPVYTDVQYVVATGDRLSLSARWILAAAYAYLGDFAAASAQYDLLSEGRMEERDGELCIKGDSIEETIKYTAYALLTASLVRKTDAEGLYRYLCTHHSTLELYQLEQAAYLKYFYPMNAKPSEFVWSVGKAREEVSLKPGEIRTISLNKSDWKALVVDADANVRVRAAYLGGVEEALAGEESADRLRIEKTITPYDETRNIYKVTLDYTVTTDKNFDSFAISDYIPNGARWYPMKGESTSSSDKSGGFQSFAYVSQLTGQSVAGYVSVYHDRTDLLAGLTEVTLQGSVSYYIRGAAEGEFVVDYAVLRDRSSGRYAISKHGNVKVKEKEWEVTMR